MVCSPQQKRGARGRRLGKARKAVSSMAASWVQTGGRTESVGLAKRHLIGSARVPSYCCPGMEGGQDISQLLLVN